MSTAETHLPVAAASPLTEVLRARIEALAGHQAHPRGACIEALQLVQAEHGWISDEHLREVAVLLRMSPADLDGVATFFNLLFRRPVGRNVILLCDSVSCWLMGRERLQAALRARLGIEPGQTTPDQAFTLLPTVCLGHCDHAPAMMIGERLYGDVDETRLDQALAESRAERVS